MSGDKDALIYLADVQIDELEAENAKLREELADAPKCETCEAMLDCDECLRADDSQKERKRLDYENAKLRELVKHLRECTRHNVCTVCEYAEEACDFDYDMRELGIEVDA